MAGAQLGHFPDSGTCDPHFEQKAILMSPLVVGRLKFLYSVTTMETLLQYQANVKYIYSISFAITGKMC